MQGHKRTNGALPETIGFDSASSSTEAVVDRQICWSNMRNTADISGFLVSSGDDGAAYMNSVRHDSQNFGRWILGESSSSSGGQIQVNRVEQKAEHGHSSSFNNRSGVGEFQDRPREPISNTLSNNSGATLSNNQRVSRVMLMQGCSSDTVSRDINLNSRFLGPGVDNSQTLGCTDVFRCEGSETGQIPSISDSSDPFAISSRSGGYLEVESSSRPGFSFEGRRLSCKRKAHEGHIEQSSGSGSSNYLPPVEGAIWHSVASQDNAASTLSISTISENPVGASPLEQVNPRLGLGVGTAFESPPVFGGSENVESSRRNSRLRINTSHQEDFALPDTFLGRSTVENFNVPLPNHSSRSLQLDNFLNLIPPESSNVIAEGLSDANPSAFRQNLSLSRWNTESSSRLGSSPSFLLSGERDAISHESSNSRRIPRSISEHPMFSPSADIRSLPRTPSNWAVTGGNMSAAGNMASTSRPGSRSSVHSLSIPDRVPRRSPPRYSRRLSEIVCRSLLSAPGSEPEVRSSHHSSLRLGPSLTPEMTLPPGVGNQARHPSHSRSAAVFQRQLNNAFGVPYSVRSLAGGGEGRSRIVSEIRNVLDLVRRGEALRFEDVMILDQSVFLGMADNDRHRDMRLDIDNMSYEELLALEDRIGNVCTGLSEETVLNRLKRRKYLSITTEDRQGIVPCCICQEQYNDGEDVGKLDCGHDFHTDCVKQWLTRKNLCPICKMTGLVT